ncbi:ATP/GTP-binding protein [Pseudodesulfovibrio profundus]|jgi:predicted ATP-dependent endonuclease of OLD family|uniref:ATP/GTP-binding protein n=1 Tax=Pseudodesulfovibrio profundus TaxID=57320 RepID=A0A2C8F6P7_9BACT|nr:ATP-binding protein [Pseudodesulfovibrio profundus]SOB58048.1 ATP/GTP-binding protein [Pseudodesulfovibrio profundus]
MKISQVKIANFRGYKEEISIDLNNLTVFVGKNDVGKSTVLEVLDVFFNEGKGVIKLDKEDINKQGLAEGNSAICIAVVFEELPTSLVIDSTNATTLQDEYLLNRQGKLEILKTYPNAGKEKVSVKAYHPSNPDCADLLLKKQKDLQAIIRKESIPCDDEKKNAVMRKAIWSHYSDELQLSDVEIDVTKEDAKNIWDQLKNYMPLYSLFQSDRKNSDGDSEIQDPMKLAVQEILKGTSIQDSLNQIAMEVDSKLKEVAGRTLEKLKEMNPEIANSLNPVFPPAEALKWADVFKNVSISGDEDIPINKRGSGVKRLILLNFFRAEAERRKTEKNVPDIIYAIEEPETSQHPDHQKKLIDAFIEMSKGQYTQLILTTHSPAIVKMLDFEHLKLIKGEQIKEVITVERHNLPYPSLNEVNFLAFNESDEGYHNELYGYIESEGWLSDFKDGKLTRSYTRLMRTGQTQQEQKILSEYIRHQIHHPENAHNQRFTTEELRQSISEMRTFIVGKQNA